MQSPELYAADFPTTIYCCVDTTKPALIDAEHRLCIGYETYFFSSDEAKAEFMINVPKYCGAITDPVTKDRFYPERKSPQITHKNRLYYFTGDSTKSMFEMMPEMYEDPRYAMIKPDSTSQQ